MRAPARDRRRLVSVLRSGALLGVLGVTLSACRAESSRPAPQAPPASVRDAAILGAGSLPQAAPKVSAAAAKRNPRDVADALALKAAGIRWSNVEIRAYYRSIVKELRVLAGRWLAEGRSVEARARLAYAHRKNARLTARAMMGDAAEVEALRARDLEKYGNVDGPTFEGLVAKAEAAGLRGDAIYERILGAAGRTNRSVDARLAREAVAADAGAAP